MWKKSRVLFLAMVQSDVIIIMAGFDWFVQFVLSEHIFNVTEKFVLQFKHGVVI